MKAKRISDLEQEVMNIVWSKGECTIRDVFDTLTLDKQLAYTTVATLLNRLYTKGLLKRDTKENIVYFSPKVSKESYGKKVANVFFNRFFDAFGDTAVASFAQSLDKLPKEKKEHILQLLSDYENKNK
jgi:predicted transcriptional regulator